LTSITFKREGTFVLVGTPERDQLAAPSACVPSSIRGCSFDDYGYDSTTRDGVHLERLQDKIRTTEFRIIQQPRPGRRLLVLDLDYTVFDCREGSLGIEELKRPFLDPFLVETYKKYDIVVWSQTKWKWVEMKCTELGLLTSPSYGLCFVLDQSSMFSVSRRDRSGVKSEHAVKALEVIWSNFSSLWGPHNTLHVDDLSRNFAMNPKNGIKVSAYRVSKRHKDTELLLLRKYLDYCAGLNDLSLVDHTSWKKKVKSDLMLGSKNTTY